MFFFCKRIFSICVTEVLNSWILRLILPSDDSKEKSIGKSKNNSQLLSFTSSQLQEKNEMTLTKDWSIMGKKIRTFEERFKAAENMPLWICTKGQNEEQRTAWDKTEMKLTQEGRPQNLFVTGYLRKHQKRRSHSRTTLGRRCPEEKRHGEGSGGALLGPWLLSSFLPWCTFESYFPRCPSPSTSTHKLTCVFGYLFPNKYKCFSATVFYHRSPRWCRKKSYVSGFPWPLLPCSHAETRGWTSVISFSRLRYLGSWIVSASQRIKKKKTWLCTSECATSVMPGPHRASASYLAAVC